MNSKLRYQILSNSHHDSKDGKFAIPTPPPSLKYWDSEEYLSSDNEDQWDMSAEERAKLTGGSRTETTTVPKAYFNLTVCILASALLSIPFGFDKCGWLGGTIILLTIGIMVDYTLLCLGETCIKLNIYDYQEIAEYSFGRKGRYVQAAVQLFLSLSLMVSYQIIAASNVQSMLKSEWIERTAQDNVPLNTLLILLITVIVVVPLATLATLKVLGYSSMISVLAVAILSIALLYFDIKREPANSIPPIHTEVLTGLSVFATGFVCHQIVTPTLDSLEDDVTSKKSKFHTVVHMAIVTSFIFFCSVGIMGYYLCHDPTGKVPCPGSILDWEREDVGSIKEHAFGKVAILMFLITVLFAYPLEHYSCYNTMIKLLYGEWGRPPKSMSLGIKLALIVLTTVPAFFITDVGPLLAWAGNLAAFPLGFLLPLALAIHNRNEGVPTPTGEVVFRCLLLLLSILLMGSQTIQAVVQVYYGFVR